MSNKLQIRRGTKAELDLITLSAGELGWTTDTKGLYIGDGANNKLYATEYIDWSATGAEQIHADRLSGILSGVLLADGTIPLTANWNIGNFKIGINTVPSYPLHIRGNTSDEASRDIYIYDTPSGTHTTNRFIYGAYIDITSSADEDTYSSRIYGLNLKVDSTGEINTLYGLYGVVTHNSPDSISTISADFTQARITDGYSTLLYGASNNVYVAADGSAASAYACYNLVQMSAATKTLTTAYGLYSRILQTLGTVSTGYLLHGSYSGTVGTKWGLYLTGETKSYFSGQVGIKETSPAADLDIAGTLILLNGTSINEFSTDGTLAGDSDDAVPTEKAVKAYVDANAGGVPTGMIVAWPLSSVPSGFHECNGSLPSMTGTYEDLYDVIGNAYGLDGAVLTFTADYTTNTLTYSSSALTENQVLELTNSGGALPAGLLADTKYFAVSVTATTFQVSLTSGGAAVGFTDNGTGTHYFHSRFKLPDMRGEFLRGYDHGIANDPDAASRTDRGDGTTGDNVGTKQADEFKAHTHALRRTSDNTIGGSGVRVRNNGTDVATGGTGGNETRARNIYVMWCIKF